jgi:hypothetical protein
VGGGERSVGSREGRGGGGHALVGGGSSGREDVAGGVRSAWCQEGSSARGVLTMALAGE